MKTTGTPKKDMYAQVTDEIIALLESGKTSRLTWARSGDGLPRNHKTGTAYQGVNVLLLWAAAATGGYSSDRWLTYKQATDMGGQVRKGEKSVTCVFFKTLEVESENEGDEAEKAYSMRMIKPFWLFNLDQIDGVDPAWERISDWVSGPNFCDLCKSVGVKRCLPLRYKKSYGIEDARRNYVRPMNPFKRMIFNLDA